MNMSVLDNLTRRSFIKTAAAVSAGVSVAGCAQGFSSKASRKPNILYLMTDQHRADCLGCVGNKVIKTPHLDSIAKDGVVFSNAYSSTPSCTCARSALLTGLSPWHHGMLGYGRIAPEYPFELPQALRDAGYYTFAIGKMHWHPQKKRRGYHGTLVDESGRVATKGFISDYRKWFKEQAPDLNPDATGIGWNEYSAKTYVLPEKLHPTHWTGQTAVDFIEKYDKSEPFLLKVSFARPHSPYDPPKRFMEMYRQDDMPAPVVGDWAKRYADVKKPVPASTWHGDLGVAQAKASRRGYYGSISFIDEQIGRILAVLKKRGLYDNTLIVFTADHGDMLGDHHLWRKTYAYEASAGIPMLLRWPKAFGHDAQRGTTRTEVAELRDVLPTFLDAAQIAIPDHLDGKSMLRPVRGDKRPWHRYIDMEHAMCYNKDHWNALTDGRYKYIYYAYDGREELFDLVNDPGETRNLAGDAASGRTLKHWRNEMVGFFAERGEQFVRDGKLTLRKKKLLYSPLFPQKT